MKMRGRPLIGGLPVTNRASSLASVGFNDVGLLRSIGDVVERHRLGEVSRPALVAQANRIGFARVGRKFQVAQEDDLCCGEATSFCL